MTQYVLYLTSTNEVAEFAMDSCGELDYCSILDIYAMAELRGIAPLGMSLHSDNHTLVLLDMVRFGTVATNAVFPNEGLIGLWASNEHIHMKHRSTDIAEVLQYLTAVVNKTYKQTTEETQ